MPQRFAHQKSKQPSSKFKNFSFLLLPSFPPFTFSLLHFLIIFKPRFSTKDLLPHNFHPRPPKDYFLHTVQLRLPFRFLFSSKAQNLPIHKIDHEIFCEKGLLTQLFVSIILGWIPTAYDKLIQLSP